MQRFVRSAVGAMSLTAVAATAAAQQPAAPAPAAQECDVNQGVTPTMAKASFSMTRAIQNTNANADATADLKRIVSSLTAPDATKGTKNNITRDFLLGQAYILLLQQPNATPVVTRSALGISSNPTGTIDLFVAADSAFTAVESAAPACAAATAQWRLMKPWANTVNAAVAAINANKVDSAELLARRTLVLDRTAPYAYSILGAVARARKDYATAATFLRQAAEAASRDTLYNEAKANALFDLGAVATLRAEAATGAQKRTLAQEAITAWKAFLAVGGSDPRAATALQFMTKLQTSTGDSAGAAQAYAPMLANPTGYSELALLHAGVVATRLNRPADAVKLFAPVVARNPNQRDAISNLAASYIGTKEFAKALPLVDKLVQLDPNGADSWLLYAFTYSGMLKGTKDPRLTRAYTDSLVKYSNKADNLPAAVSFTEFSTDTAKVTLAGTIENRTAAPKSYTMSVDFLDRTGAVVGTQSVSVGPVAPKAKAPFSVTLPKGGAEAFRYKPLS